MSNSWELVGLVSCWKQIQSLAMFLILVSGRKKINTRGGGYHQTQKEVQVISGFGTMEGLAPFNAQM